MWICFIFFYEVFENILECLVEEYFSRLEWGCLMVGGFKVVKKLEGNIGYFDLWEFVLLIIGVLIVD